ncbi:hypothetical protein F9N47_17650 [Salmonella enterica]|nr:hypothetical protein [Salmonella enterica]EEB5141884.1 hypothetical protein [Salmonella enterica]
MKHGKVFILTCLLAMPVLSQAIPLRDYLYLRSEARDDPKVEDELTFYERGLADGALAGSRLGDYLYKDNSSFKGVICEPGELVWSRGLVRDILDQYVKERATTSTDSIDVGIVFIYAMQQKYPCKKRH